MDPWPPTHCDYTAAASTTAPSPRATPRHIEKDNNDNDDTAVDWSAFLAHCMFDAHTECVQWLGPRRGTQPVAYLKHTRTRVDARILYQRLLGGGGDAAASSSSLPPPTAWKGRGALQCKTAHCLNWHHYAPTKTKKKRPRSSSSSKDDDIVVLAESHESRCKRHVSSFV